MRRPPAIAVLMGLLAALIAARRDRQPPAPDTVVIDHPNLRGPGYFH